jgi:hypothetical protein
VVTHPPQRHRRREHRHGADRAEQDQLGGGRIDGRPIQPEAARHRADAGQHQQRKAAQRPERQANARAAALVLGVGGLGRLLGRQQARREVALEGSQRPVQLAHARVTLRRVLGHRSLDHDLQPLGDRRLEHAGALGLAAHHRQHRHLRRLLDERGAARRHCVQDGADSVDIRAMIRDVAMRLLRRHVAGRAHDHAGLRQLAVAIDEAR